MARKLGILCNAQVLTQGQILHLGISVATNTQPIAFRRRNEPPRVVDPVVPLRGIVEGRQSISLIQRWIRARVDRRWIGRY